MNKAVTLVEVIIGAIILSFTFAGLLATFIGVRKYVNRANKRIIAANLVVCQLNNLYQAVSADTWNSGDLRDTTIGGPISLNEYVIDNHTYQDVAQPNSYTVTTVGDYRRVSVKINYP